MVTGTMFPPTKAFAGEPYLQVNLPNYQHECFLLTIGLLVALILWLVVYPLLVNGETSSVAANDDPHKKKKKANMEAQKTGESAKPAPTKDKATSAQNSSSTTKSKTITVGKIQKRVRTTATESATSMDELSRFAIFLSAVLGATLTCTAIVVLGSPYNYYLLRRVFVFPIFTADECQAIIEMAEQAALVNYQEAQQWSVSLPNGTELAPDPSMMEASTDEETFRTMLQRPLGWHKLRHGNYPTTDLNLVTDPFSKQNRTYLGNLLDRRLAPTLERIYGIPRQAFRAIDMFVVRYDEGIRTHLERHTDDGDVSFTILLNEDFEGGGTRFWQRTHETPSHENVSSFAHVQPSRVGTVVTNHALINHEGFPVSKGTRIILVGFTSVDRFDPWTDKPTGLGWSFASWWNLAWLNVKFKTGYYNGIERMERQDGEIQKWFDHPKVRSLFAEMTNFMEYVGDKLSPHKIEYLVSDEEAEPFLQALDHAYYSEHSDQNRTTRGFNVSHSRMAPSATTDASAVDIADSEGHANWWKGQMVNLDFTGKVDSYWSPRFKFEDRFAEL